MQKTKIQNIEFLRIMFTTFVICFHFFSNLKIWCNGWLGVEFFFILSGFFLVYTFKSNLNVLSFIKQKISRFVPLLIFVSLVRYFVKSNLYIVFNDNNFFSNMFSGILFFQVPGLHHHFGYLNVSWYIQILFWVSLLYFYLMKYYRKETVNMIILLIVFFSYIGITSTTWSCRTEINEFFKVNLLRGLGGMGIGYFGALFIMEGHRISFKNKIVYSIIELLLLLYCFMALFCKDLYPNNSLLYVIAVFFLIILFIQKDGYFSNLLNEYNWSAVSKYCLATYLCQGIIVYDLFGIFYAYYPKDWPLGYFIGFIILSCWLLGIFSYHIVEKNGKIFMDNLLSNDYEKLKTKE